MLEFLPHDLNNALKFLNKNYLTEIRLRMGQPVIIEYKGEYKYINACGCGDNPVGAIVCGDVSSVLNKAMRGNVFSYAEQLKSGFITVDHGVRIGVAGEYITENGAVKSITGVTSLNIRIPHDVRGCSDAVSGTLFAHGVRSTLIYSRPGLGKTTMLRDLAVWLSATGRENVLVFDERREISAMDAEGYGYNLGDRVDVVRCSDKLGSIKSAIRAMKPQIIITDELYGENDSAAVRYARDCGICVIASTHVCDTALLQSMPFDFYVKLIGIGERPVIYDKNFNPCGNNSSFDDGRGNAVVG